MRRATILTVLLVAGCHAILPLGAPSGDAAVIDGAPDQPPGDFPPVPPPPDHGVEQNVPGVDGCVPAPDLGPLTKSQCVDNESFQLVGCPGPCGPADDPDCDGLKSPRDPQPTQHNPLLLGDGFGDEPFLAGRWSNVAQPACIQPATLGWDGVGAVQAKWCAEMVLKSKCSLPFADPDYLVELRFTVNAIQAAVDWSIYIYFGDDPGQRYCRFQQHPNVALGVPHIQIESAGSGKFEPIPSLEPVSSQIEGQTFILQGYSINNPKTGTVHQCRLLSGDGGQVIEAALRPGSTIKQPLPLKVKAHNLDLTMDFIHARQLYPPPP